MQPSQNTTTSSKRSKVRSGITLIIILLLLVVTADVVMKVQARYHAKHVNDYSYKDNNLQLTTVGGLHFLKPSEYGVTSIKNDNKFNVAAYTHKRSDGYQIGYIIAIDFKDALASDPQYLHNVNLLMPMQEGHDKEVYLSAIQHQVFDSYTKGGYTAELSGQTKFTNDNIKQNAWSFDIKMTHSNPGMKPMQGRLIYVIAPGNFYYFAVMALQANWSSNQATWQQMVNSIKVN